MATIGERSGNVNRDISQAMVALFKDSTGRGPTRVRTYVENGLVVTVLYDTMTKAERTLMDDHQEDVVRDLRRIFQGTFRKSAIEIGERLPGRRARAFPAAHPLVPTKGLKGSLPGPGPGASAACPRRASTRPGWSPAHP